MQWENSRTKERRKPHLRFTWLLDAKQVITDIAHGEADLDTLKAGASLIPAAKITKVPKVVKAIGNVGKTGSKKGKEGEKIAKSGQAKQTKARDKEGSGALENSNYSGVDNVADGAKLKEYYKQAEKYGTGSIKELENGRYRFYEELKLAKTEGEMIGARHVREWNPYTRQKRDWYETLDHNGNIRQVRPDPNTTGGIKVHYMFDKDGNYMGSWSPK